MLSAVLLGELTAGNEGRMIVNLGLTVVLLFGALISIFVGVGLVAKEIEKRTIYAIFSKPVGRAEFILGKYFGLCLTLMLNLLVMAVGIGLTLLYVGKTELILPSSFAVLLTFFELMILTALAILFSSFSSPMLSALLTFLVFLIGHFSVALKQLGEALGSAFVKYLFNGLYYVLPNLSFFSFATEASHGKVPPFNYLLTAAAYSVVYVAILLTISAFIFTKRNFK
jgi:ABC-type transport system involved in multi-copper enzyme maturation permease subunit